MTKSPKRDVGERRADQGIGRNFRSVVITLVVFYVSAGVLNGKALHEDAKKREYGQVRDMWVAATRPLNDICILLKLDHLREGVENLRKETP